MKHIFGWLGIPLAALSLFGARGAQAAPQNWLVNATFLDGGTMSGSFGYDADTQAYSDVDVTTSGGAPENASLNRTYTFVCTAACPSPANGFLVYFHAEAPVGDLTTQPALTLDFSFLGPLADTSPMPFIGENLTCGNNDCRGRSGADRVAGSGIAALAPAAPAPSGWRLALFGLSLAGVAGWHLKRRATN